MSGLVWCKNGRLQFFFFFAFKKKHTTIGFSIEVGYKVVISWNSLDPLEVMWCCLAVRCVSIDRPVARACLLLGRIKGQVGRFISYHNCGFYDEEIKLPNNIHFLRVSLSIKGGFSFNNIRNIPAANLSATESGCKLSRCKLIVVSVPLL